MVGFRFSRARAASVDSLNSLFAFAVLRFVRLDFFLHYPWP